MTTNFFIKNIEKIEHETNKDHLIYVRYDHGGLKTLFSTGIYALPQQLNTIQRRSRKKIDPSKPLNKNRTGHIAINTRLKRFLEKVEEAITEAYKQEDLSPQNVKRIFQLKESTTNSEEPTTLSIIEAIELISDQKRHQLSENTLKGYRSLKNHLTDYLKTKQTNRKAKITFQDLDRDFYDKWIDYLKEDSNLKSNSSIDKDIKNLKTIAMKLKELGHEVNDAIFLFPRLKVETHIIYLYPEELNSIQKVELDTEFQKRQRDLFVLHCQVGVRYSDLHQITKDNIKEIGKQKILTIASTQKTKKSIQIPLSDPAISILEQFNYQLPILSDQKYRDHIKNLCQRAGLNRIVESNKGKMPLHKYAGTHIARKTFISHALQRGIDILDISLITGTSREVIFKNYAGEKRIIELAKSW